MPTTLAWDGFASVYGMPSPITPPVPTLLPSSLSSTSLSTLVAQPACPSLLRLSRRNSVLSSWTNRVARPFLGDLASTVDGPPADTTYFTSIPLLSNTHRPSAAANRPRYSVLLAQLLYRALPNVQWRLPSASVLRLRPGPPASRNPRPGRGARTRVLLCFGGYA